MKDYIERMLEEAFCDTIDCKGNNTFILDIASTQDFSAFERSNMKNLIDLQLSIFMPVIQKFIIEALTQNIRSHIG